MFYGGEVWDDFAHQIGKWGQGLDLKSVAWWFAGNDGGVSSMLISSSYEHSFRFRHLPEWTGCISFL